MMSAGMNLLSLYFSCDEIDGSGELRSGSSVTDRNLCSPCMKKVDQICAATMGAKAENENLQSSQLVRIPVGSHEFQFFELGR